MVRLIIHTKHDARGHSRWSIEYDGEMIVVDSKSPEAAAATALLAKGITGKAQTYDAVSGIPRLKFDIQKFAKSL